MAKQSLIEFIRQNDARSPRWVSYLQKAWAKERVIKLRQKLWSLRYLGRWSEVKALRLEFGMDAPDFLLPLQKPAKKREKVYIPVEYRRLHRVV